MPKIDKVSIAAFSSGLLIVFVSAFLWTSIGKNGIIALDLAKTIFSALIQVNATIIGFWGIILVYFLKILFDNRQNYLDSNWKIIEKMENIIFGEENSENVNDTSRLDFLKKRSLSLNESVERIDSTMRDFVAFGLVILICFLASIFFSILLIGKATENGVETYWIFASVLTLFLGISNMFYGLWQTVPTTKSIGDMAKQPS